MSVSVLLVDDHGVVRKGLRYLLEKEPDIEVVGEAGDGLSALKMAAETSPDVIVMDLTMPGMNGIEATRRVIAERADARILCLSMYSESRFVVEMLEAGATGYLLKDCADQELVVAIRKVVDGQLYLSPSVSGAVVEAYRNKEAGHASTAIRLSPREREVLQLIAEGHSTRQIAERLHVSSKTVWSHRENIMHKLRIQSIAGLTKYAIRKGITSSTG
ncbi:MAG: response regulator transcription factor [Acidobacteriota bacterium]|nr:response regulator transcription factor [Acidobacteriota bacterium]MDH3784635.1 response regulator transcription factor [Acidobacteriota bacterium]